MFKIKVCGDFSAAHRIDGYSGDCSRLHGHNWRVCVSIVACELDELGLACDFREAKSILREVLGELDHRMLNDHPWLDGGNPTSELLAMAIYRQIAPLLPKRLSLDSVEIFESDRTSVEFREDRR